MATAQDVLSSGWAKLAGTLVLALLTYFIGRSGQNTVEVPAKPPKPKIVTQVVQETLTVYKPILDIDTFIATAPDTCDQWLTRLRAEILMLRKTLDSISQVNRPGTLTFADSTYWKAYRLWIWGKFHYPDGEGGVLYNWEKAPFFHKPGFSLAYYQPLFGWPTGVIGKRLKNNWWGEIGVRPHFSHAEFKMTPVIGIRFEF